MSKCHAKHCVYRATRCCTIEKRSCACFPELTSTINKKTNAGSIKLSTSSKAMPNTSNSRYSGKVRRISFASAFDVEVCLIDWRKA